VKVSILIPCYNADKWIGEAIESALRQDHPDKEIIVVDDGSTDGSRGIIRSFGDRIRSAFTENRGGNAARNRLLRLAAGDWLQYLDADDYLLREKISAQIRQLDRTPDVDMLFGPSLWRYEDDPLKTIQRIEIPLPHDPWILLVRWYLPQTGSPLWRKRALLDIGGWNEQQTVCQEHEVYFRLLSERKRFQYTEVAGAVYRHWSEETLCRNDKLSTYRERLRIIDLAERYLLSRGELGAIRQDAIDQSRFVCARILWERDPGLAKALVARIYSERRNFVPSDEFAPAFYRFLLRTFGFSATEHVAALTRSLRRRTAFSRVRGRVISASHIPTKT
jgi:glycosyltransferase involved in cell wall biosynthesis